MFANEQVTAVVKSRLQGVKFGGCTLRGEFKDRNQTRHANSSLLGGTHALGRQNLGAVWNLGSLTTSSDYENDLCIADKVLSVHQWVKFDIRLGCVDKHHFELALRCRRQSQRCRVGWLWPSHPRKAVKQTFHLVHAIGSCFARDGTGAAPQRSNKRLVASQPRPYTFHNKGPYIRPI